MSTIIQATMTATDPTYPFLPIMCILASVLLISMLLNGLVRQNWNIGVAFLCFWLLVDNVTYAISTIAWSDNYTIKFYIYCDLTTRLQFISSVAQSMATLLITRRLSLIASMRSVEPNSKKTKRWDVAVEWTLGFAVPLIAGGPIYYVVQAYRFQVFEVFGCQDAVSNDALGALIQLSATVLIPLLSVTLYYPRIVWVFYFHGRDVDRFLRSNNSVSRLNYFRVLALSSIDLIFTLPVNATDGVLQLLALTQEFGRLPFYQGWVEIHTDWEPEGFSYDELRASPDDLAQAYFTFWSSPALAFITFGLFGLTTEARASYYRGFCAVARRFGWDMTSRGRGQNARSTLGSMQFEVRHPEISLDAGVGTNPSFVDRTRNPVAAQTADSGSGSLDVESKTYEYGHGHERAPRIPDEHEHVEPRALEEGTAAAPKVTT
ncbi:STE3-domain-containing protein [Peniophora sp. CONT]|nr:STE3-domain-containing protein [Peniophora sp. CONT]